MKWMVVGLSLVLVLQYGFCAMSEKQMNATKKLVRNTCTNKAKVDPEVVDAMHNGDFSQGQCYVLCLLNTYKLISPDGSFDWEGGIKALSANAPASLFATASITIKNCKDSLKNKKDKCLGAAEVAKCLYDDNPPDHKI